MELKVPNFTAGIFAQNRFFPALFINFACKKTENTCAAPTVTYMPTNNEVLQTLPYINING